jgi:cell envelope opacity-associated protein A
MDAILLCWCEFRIDANMFPFSFLRFSTRKSQTETETTEKVQRKGLLGKLGLKKTKKAKAEEEPVEDAPATESPVDPEPAAEGEDARQTEDKEEAPVDPEPTEDEAARDQPEDAKAPSGETGMFCGCL